MTELYLLQRETIIKNLTLILYPDHEHDTPDQQGLNEEVAEQIYDRMLAKGYDIYIRSDAEIVLSFNKKRPLK